MPGRDTVESLVALVEAGRFVEAMERFYADDATMQENHRPPRVGKPALLAHERGVMASAAGVTARCVRPLLVEGEHVVVRWVFEFTAADGRRSRLEELAWQRWRGDQIVQEQFFYDPAQSRLPAARA